ncbi:unnamed protein product, partial [Closterium sp. NIES-54]
DVGEWQADGSMKIVDRKKNIFKLAQGEYVAVENLENVYGNCSAIDMVWVYGNSFEAVLVAVVVPNQPALEAWAKGAGVEHVMSLFPMPLNVTRRVSGRRPTARRQLRPPTSLFPCSCCPLPSCFFPSPSSSTSPPTSPPSSSLSPSSTPCFPLPALATGCGGFRSRRGDWWGETKGRVGRKNKENGGGGSREMGRK